jgi:parvulin-like peptidyl-prolyl isomerase
VPHATSAWFTATQPVPGLDLGPEATKAIFALGTNLADRIAEPLVASNKAYVVQLTDRRPARVRDLAEVKDVARHRAMLKARDDALLDAAKTKRDAIAAVLKAGQDFTNAVASVQLVGTNKVTFSRGGGELRAVPGLFQIVNELDTAKPGDLLGPVIAYDGAFIARLNAVKPADPAGFAAVKENYSNGLKRSRYEALAKDFEADAEKRVQVEARKDKASGT